MKTTKNLSIRQALLATAAVAGLVVGTAACGGKNDSSVDAEKQQLVELLLSAARSGDQVDVADIIAEADPALVAQILPEIDDVVAIPESSTDRPADTVAPDADAEVAPEADAVAPEATPEEVAPEADAEVAPEADAGSGSGALPDFDLGLDFPIFDVPDFGTPDLDFDFGAPNIGALTVTAPDIQFASFWSRGPLTDVWVTIDEGSGHVMSNITSVKLSYRIGALTITKHAVFDAELDNDIYRWVSSGTTIQNGTEVTITVKNAFGLTDTFVVIAEVSAPL